MAAVITQESTHAHDFLRGRIAYEISSLVGAFRDGDQVMLKIDEYAFHLSSTQADLLAQGFLMAALCTGLGRLDMPWRNGKIHDVSAIPKKTSRTGMRFTDATLYIPEADHKFFATGWLYEGTGEDLDYPANVVFLKTRLDDVIGFGKGNDEFLLNPKHVAQLCLELADSANLHGTRVWNIWDKRIEWSAGNATSDKAAFELANEALFDYLKSYKPIV